MKEPFRYYYSHNVMLTSLYLWTCNWDWKFIKSYEWLQHCWQDGSDSYWSVCNQMSWKMTILHEFDWKIAFWVQIFITEWLKKMYLRGTLRFFWEIERQMDIFEEFWAFLDIFSRIQSIPGMIEAFFGISENVWAFLQQFWYVFGQKHRFHAFLCLWAFWNQFWFTYKSFFMQQIVSQWKRVIQPKKSRNNKSIDLKALSCWLYVIAVTILIEKPKFVYGEASRYWN